MILLKRDGERERDGAFVCIVFHLDDKLPLTFRLDYRRFVVVLL